MSLENQMQALSAVAMLNAVDAANTAAATSAYISVAGFEGDIAIVISTGILDAGSIAYTFSHATDAGGTADAAIVPQGGALTQITTANDNGNPYIAVFPVSKLQGFIRVIGTIVTGGALVSYTLIGRQKTV